MINIGVIVNLTLHTCIPGTVSFQLTFTAKAFVQTYGDMKYGKEHEVSYLPLASIAAQVRACTYVCRCH